MLSKEHRVHTDQFKDIYTQGSSVFSPLFKVKYLPSTSFRAAVVMAKKTIKKRVLRNKQKRRILAALRKYTAAFPYVLILTVLRDPHEFSFQDLEKEIDQVLKKLK